jgi:hypothetical protein
MGLKEGALQIITLKNPLLSARFEHGTLGPVAAC